MPPQLDELATLLGDALGEVLLRLGPNALAIAEHGQPIRLSGNEREAVTQAVLPLLARLVRERDEAVNNERAYQDAAAEMRTWTGVVAERDRYRAAWLSARKRVKRERRNVEQAEKDRDEARAAADADTRQLAEVDERCDRLQAEAATLKIGNMALDASVTELRDCLISTRQELEAAQDVLRRVRNAADLGRLPANTEHARGFNAAMGVVRLALDGADQRNAAQERLSQEEEEGQ